MQLGCLGRAAQLEQYCRRALDRLGHGHGVFGELVGLDDLPQHAVELLGLGVTPGLLSQQFDAARPSAPLTAGVLARDTIHCPLKPACQQEIISEMERNNEDVKKDAFGHVRLDDINSGKWFAKRFSKTVGAEKTLVQKSGYFARSAAPNEADLILIKKSAALAVQFALNNQSGVVGMDEDNDGEPTIIDFDRIKGGKPFNTKNDWFQNMLQEIGQID